MIEFVVSLLNYNNQFITKALSFEKITDREKIITEIQCRALETIGQLAAYDFQEITKSMIFEYFIMQ